MLVMTAACCILTAAYMGEKKVCWKETTYLEGFTQDTSFLSVF